MNAMQATLVPASTAFRHARIFLKQHAAEASINSALLTSRVTLNGAKFGMLLLVLNVHRRGDAGAADPARPIRVIAAQSAGSSLDTNHAHRHQQDVGTCSDSSW